MRSSRIRILLWLCLLGLIILAACSPELRPTPAWGVLSGHVSIGPLSPVERLDVPTVTPAPELYAPWRVVIYDPDMSKEIARVEIGTQGNYAVELPPGKYQVDLIHLGIVGSIARGVNLPAQVEIRSGETTSLDIEIDTGIR